MNSRLARIMTLGAAIAAAGAVAAYAHSGAEGVVKERMALMKDIGSNLKRIGTMMNGGADFDGEAAQAAAEAIARRATNIPDKFPEGSAQHPSEASEAIWSQWDRFEDFAADLQQSAEGLAARAASASTASEVKREFGRLASTCKGCHEAFRVENGE